MHSLFLVSLTLFQLTSGAKDDTLSDPSFKMFCNRFKGKFETRRDEVGDKCTVGFEILTEDEEEAMNFCKLWLPYHILDAKPSVTSPNKKTSTCVAEVAQVCPYGWNLMRNRCYKLVDPRMHYTWEEAEQKCVKAHNGGKIVELKTRMAHIWRAFYPHLTHIWVRPEKYANQFIRYDEESLNETDKATALVYESAVSYETRPMTLIRIGKKDQSMVICEFTPPPSYVEARIISEKLSKVYFPMTVTAKSVMIRGRIHLGRRMDKRNIENKYCLNIGKMISLPLIAANILNLDQLDKNMTYSRSIAICSKNECKSKSLGSSFKDYFDFPCLINGKEAYCELPDENNDQHDSVIQGSVVNMHNGKGFRLISDAARAPIMCTIKLHTAVKKECPKGWTDFQRESGVVFCHKVFSDELNYYDASKKCGEEKAFLTGYDSLEEFDLLISLLRKGGNHLTYWLGGERRKECEWEKTVFGKGFDQESPFCNRNEVFEWKNGVADNNNKLFENLWSRDINPSYFYDGILETCLQVFNFAKINDMDCSTTIPFICGMPVPINYVEY